MERLKGCQDCRQQQRDGNASLSSKEDIGTKNSVFGPYPHMEMLSWMKLVATGAFESSSTEYVYKMQKQSLNLRKILTLMSSKAPQRKGKLELFLKEKLKVRGNSYDWEISNLKTSSVLLSTPGSAASCLLNASHSTNGSIDRIVKGSASSLANEDNFQGKHSSPCCIFNKTHLPQENLSSILNSVENARSVHLHIIDHDESVHDSNMSSRKGLMNAGLKKRRRSPRLQYLFGDSVKKRTVPIGPRFQADVPDWDNPACKGTVPYDVGNSEELKWLGTKVWPPEGQASEFRGDHLIGKGRSDSCVCHSPGSKECIGWHMLEQRRVLKGALGPVFFSWKFDEMGEEVAKSRTTEEQKMFFMKSGSSLSKKSPFWEKALKCFPSKSREDRVSYYYNVFVPREKALQNSGSIEDVD